MMYLGPETIASGADLLETVPVAPPSLMSNEWRSPDGLSTVLGCGPRVLADGTLMGWGTDGQIYITKDRENWRLVVGIKEAE
jgi:hypothetical protein